MLPKDPINLIYGITIDYAPEIRIEATAFTAFGGRIT